MSKTRRQRSQEHPDKPKKGVRDLTRRVGINGKNAAAVELGKLGGRAPHHKRGLQAASEEDRRRVSMAGVEARRKKAMEEATDERE